MLNELNMKENLLAKNKLQLPLNVCSIKELEELSGGICFLLIGLLCLTTQGPTKYVYILSLCLHLLCLPVCQ